MMKTQFDKTNRTQPRLLKVVLLLLQVGAVLIPCVSSAQSGGLATTFGYTPKGDLASITSPAGKVTTLQWDRLGRNTAVIQNGAAIDKSYNLQHELTAVTDPKGLTTTYAKNGFGQTTAQNSPDTGVSTYFISKTDKITQKATSGFILGFTYDVEDRIASKTVTHPSLGSLTYSYSYGAPGAGAETGRLTGITAPGVAINFIHNIWGEVIKKTQTVSGAPSLVTAYDYSSATGALTGMTYPSGRVISYGLDALSRIVSIQVDGVSVVTNITYSPFGVSGWTYANGDVVTKTFDLAARLTSTTLATGQRTYGYDAEGNITSISDAVLGSATYGYDGKNRLISASTSLGQWTYAYDMNGSRIMTGVNGLNYSVAVDSGSNKTLAYSAPIVRQLGYDAQGHTNSIDGGAPIPACTGPMQLKYTADGVLVSSTGFEAVYDSQGQRLRKTPTACAGGSAVYFNYDLNGHMLGEYAATGAALQETVWLGDIPLVVLRGLKGSESPFYIYTDNLNTPRQIMNTAHQLVWSWDGEPFGASLPQEDPSGLGVLFTYNLRFAGQYYDRETGLHQNHWREYDPKQGRYVQSDPLGLEAGMNTYEYVGSNPLGAVDSFGLDWIYEQSTGYLYHQPSAELGGGPPAVISKGYSGKGLSLNSPALDILRNVGPIPLGAYSIEKQQDNVTGMGHKLPGSMRLVPDKSNWMFGRDGFLIHGDNARSDNSASQGCIILDKATRNIIGKSSDRVLRVLP